VSHVAGVRAQNSWTQAPSSLLNGQSKRRILLWMSSRKKSARSKKSWTYCAASNRSFTGAFLKRLKFSAGFAHLGNWYRANMRLPVKYFQFRHLSGDFFKVMELDSALGIVVGDIAGKDYRQESGCRIWFR